jgi:hypothetical protein
VRRYLARMAHNPRTLEVAGERLTEAQDKFAQAYVEYGNRAKAIEVARISEPYASILLRDPRFLSILAFYGQQRLQALVPISLRTLEQIQTDETAPKGVRVDCSKTLLDRAGVVARTGDQAPKDIEEFSPAELIAMAESIKTELERRQTSQNEPTGPLLDANPLDMLD